MSQSLGKHSPRVKELARLSEASERRAQGRFLVEGVRVLEEARRVGFAFEMLLYDPTRLEAPRVRELVSHWREVAFEVPGEVLTRLGAAETSQGLLGVARVPESLVSDWGQLDFVLVLDGVRDPGNLGTLIRTAWASGVEAVVLLGCADPYSPKAVRASAGGLFHLPVSREVTVEEMRQAGLELVALTPREGQSLYEFNWPPRAAWILGGEAAGQNRELLSRVDHRVTVPMSLTCESLNVAATGAVVMFERQRRLSSFRAAARDPSGSQAKA